MCRHRFLFEPTLLEPTGNFSAGSRASLVREMSSAKRKAQGKVKALVQPAAEDDEMSFPLVSVDKRKAKKATSSAVKGKRGGSLRADVFSCEPEEEEALEPRRVKPKASSKLPKKPRRLVKRKQTIGGLCSLCHLLQPQRALPGESRQPVSLSVR